MTQVRQAPIVNLYDFEPNAASFHADSHPAHYRSPWTIWLFSKPPLIVLLAVEYSKNGEEQVDDIEVKRNSRSNLLLDMIVAHDELCVH